MDRDAITPSTPAEAEPDYSPETVRTIAAIGAGLAGLAAILGLAASAFGSVPAVLNTVRLFLVLIGVVVAGGAISMRYDLWWTWATGALTATLAWFGLPAHWDSFRLVAAVMAFVGVAGAGCCCLTPMWRMIVASAAIVFHFTGIFMAATSPPTGNYGAPWITIQAFGRVYNPYLQFVYQRNAYHFYSPDPGAASLLAFLLKTEIGTNPETHEKLYETKWVVLPRRPNDVRDPLGLSYYRRLSITEQIARGSPHVIVPEQFEKTELTARRMTKLSVIPFHPAELVGLQYKLPNTDVARYLLPSYASHIILNHTPDKQTAAKTTVKIYRLEHRTMPVEQFAARMEDGKYPNPYHPGTYRPYFMGEFDALGNLVDPQEELLYWLLPITIRTPSPNDPADPFKKEYYDFLSVHALELSRDEVLKADESKGVVFNWSQLR